MIFDHVIGRLDRLWVYTKTDNEKIEYWKKKKMYKTGNITRVCLTQQ